MTRFRSRVVEIEAVQFQDDWVWKDGSLISGSGAAIPQWFLDEATDKAKGRIGVEFWANCLWIRTLEGLMKATHGDWIIKGTEGELYPCKPSVFERKYAPAEPLPEKWTHWEYEQFAGVTIGEQFVYPK